MNALQDLRRTVARLRAPGGCPWDREQTHQSLAQYLIEETAELLDTIDKLDMEHMREELGDVLLQVYLHAQIAEENGHFDIQDVAHDIDAKLIRRHPHVFGDDQLDNSEQVLKRWAEIKAQEKAGKPAASSIFDSVPRNLPALLFALEVYKKASAANLDTAEYADSGRVTQLSEGLDEEKAGRLLFEATAACRVAKIDPESALRRYAKKLIQQAKS